MEAVYLKQGVASPYVSKLKHMFLECIRRIHYSITVLRHQSV